MSEIQIFNNPDFGDVRTIIIDEELWFVGNDVAAALQYKDKYSALRKNVDEDDKRLCPVGSASGTQGTTIINESGLYSLIFNSKLESAKKFKKWVTSEVLPTIRKTGQYGQPRLPMTIPEQIQLLAQGHVTLEAKIDSVKADLEQFKSDMPILGIEETKISRAVRKKGAECLGGKQAPAYKDRSLRTQIYTDLHRQLRREFGVSSYKAIKRNQSDTAISIIERYEPPLVLAETIETANAQQEMEGLEGRK